MKYRIYEFAEEEPVSKDFIFMAEGEIIPLHEARVSAVPFCRRWPGYQRSIVTNEIRLHTIQLEYCANVIIDGITIRDSLVYNIRPICCENLHISNIKIIGCWRYQCLLKAIMLSE